MGDYTGLRFGAKLNDQAVEMIRRMHEIHFDFDPNAPHDTWERMAELYPLPEFQLWSRYDRHSFIPYGSLAYMPDDWYEQIGAPPGDHGDARLMSKLTEDNTWLVTCSLKNHMQTIEVFLQVVLPILLREPCAAEVLFESDQQPTIVMVEPRGYGLPMPKDIRRLP